MDQLEDVIRELRSAVPTESATRHKPRRRRVYVALLGLLVVILLFALRWQMVQPSLSSPAPVATLVRPTGGWIDVVRSIDRGRSAAFASGDASELLQVEVAGGTAHAADVRVLEALRVRRLAPDRQPLHVVSVEEVFVRRSTSEQVARLRVTDTMAAYALVDESGTVIDQVAGRELRTWLLDLQRVGENRWKLLSASPVRASQPSVQGTRQGM